MTKAYSEHKMPIMHSSNEESDTENLETEHFARDVNGTRNDFQI